MGSGYRDFTAGEQLTADIMDNYLMRQSVMTFASSTARDTALSGVLDEGMVAYLEDSNTFTFYTGAAWLTMSEPAQSWSLTTVGQPGPVNCTTTYGWVAAANPRRSAAPLP